MPEKVKDMIYTSALFWLKMKWKITKPHNTSARIVLIAEGHVLLVQHRKSLTWNLPGGGKKRKESPERCAIRELYEETHIHIHDTDFLLGIYENTREGKHDTIFIYVKHVPYAIDPKNAFELKNAQWYPLTELPLGTTPATRTRIQEYLNGEKDLKGKW